MFLDEQSKGLRQPEDRACDPSRPSLFHLENSSFKNVQILALPPPISGPREGVREECLFPPFPRSFP